MNAVASSLRIALVGNPNCGKTALFNRLTGAHQKVANYAGVTVERKEGRFVAPSGRVLQLLDLPGAYSLDAASPDEAITRDICEGRHPDEPAPDFIVCVADATNLRLHLRFVLELKRLGRPMVLALNMQENRSFDHYFGTLRGVRGFGDPRPISLPGGNPVWMQPNGTGHVMPFRPHAGDLGLQYMEGTPHNWPDAHGAWNRGRFDAWVPNKGTTTMAYFTREDIPFHYALADAFTVCDAYHCSLMGATDPNRYHMPPAGRC